MTRAAAGYGIRAARAEDAAAIAAIHVASWQATYAGILPDEILLSLDKREHETRWWRHVLGRFRRNHLVYVAVGGADADGLAEVIGFSSAGPSRQAALPYGGEIYTLYLKEEYHGRGIGRDLFQSTLGGVREARGPSVIVWCLSGNPSRYFYERMGGTLVARRPGRVGVSPVEEVGYGWGTPLPPAARGTA